jgi:spermidine synthase
VPDPSTSQLNRFYTREFFAEVRRILVPGGVLALSLGHYEGYLGQAMARVLAIAHRTLKEVYANVLIVPGEKVYFLASDAALTADIAGRMARAGVATRWVVPSNLAAMQKPDRLAEIDRALAADAPVNEDFSPLLYYFHLRYWMSQFKVRFGLLEGALVGLLAIYLVRIRPVPLAIFAAGFAASALEVVLLLGFQVLCGSIYRQVGLIVTMFMLGLGVGSYSMGRMLPRRRRRDLVGLLVLLAAYAAGLPWAVLALGRLGGGLGPAAAEVVIPLLTLLLAVLVGMSFPLAAKLDFCNVAATAARLYTADYVGAALGALLVSTWLIPLLGVAAVCWLTAGLCLLGGVVLAASA